MQDLLYFFQSLDVIGHTAALKAFQRTLYIKDDEKILIINCRTHNLEYARAFNYTKQKISWKLGKVCFCCLFEKYSELISDRCLNCKKYTLYKLPNTTGVPCGISIPSHFYIYNQSELIITQIIDYHTIIHTFKENKNLDNWGPLVWRRYSYIILSLYALDLVTDLIQYIIKHIVHLKISH